MLSTYARRACQHAYGLSPNSEEIDILVATLSLRPCSFPIVDCSEAPIAKSLFQFSVNEGEY